VIIATSYQIEPEMKRKRRGNSGERRRADTEGRYREKRQRERRETERRDRGERQGKNGTEDET
jgi:hypothetical protein